MSSARISISSPPDRERLVAEIFFGENQFAEINQEGDQLTVEVYPTQDGTPWSIPYSALVAALDEAKRRLTG